MIRALVNGNEIDSIPIADRGLQYGDGVFETLAVSGGRPLLWEAHLQRLLFGCRALGFEASPSVQILEREVHRLSAQLDRAVLKIVITRGAGPRGYRPPVNPTPTRVVSVDSWPEENGATRKRGVRVKMCHTILASQRRLAGLKHLNRLEQVLARAEWNDEWDEGLMCGEAGTVIEATMSNVFAVVDGVLHTPDLTLCGIAGVMRDQVMRAARRLNLEITIDELSVDRMYAAQEVFLTNSIIGIWPVRAVENRVYGIGPVTRSLWQALNDQSNLVVVD